MEYTNKKFKAKKLLLINDNETKKNILLELFRRSHNIMIVCPYISGTFITKCINISNAKIRAICQKNVLQKQMSTFLKNKCVEFYPQEINIFGTEIHTKYIIFDNKYIFIGSTNYMDQSFGIKTISSNIKDKLMNHVAQEFDEIDLLIQCRYFANLLVKYTNSRFGTNLQINYDIKNDFKWKKYKYLKNIYFKVYLFDPLIMNTNPISNRIIELLDKYDSCSMYIKSFTPPLHILDKLKNINLNIYSNFGGNNFIGWFIERASIHNLSYLNNVKIYINNHLNNMFHHKVYIFDNIILLGSYNMSFRSEYKDTEIMLEFDQDIGYNHSKYDFKRIFSFRDYILGTITTLFAKYTF